MPSEGRTDHSLPRFRKVSSAKWAWDNAQKNEALDVDRKVSGDRISCTKKYPWNRQGSWANTPQRSPFHVSSVLQALVVRTFQSCNVNSPTSMRPDIVEGKPCLCVLEVECVTE